MPSARGLDLDGGNRLVREDNRSVLVDDGPVINVQTNASC